MERAVGGIGATATEHFLCHNAFINASDDGMVLVKKNALNGRHAERSMEDFRCDANSGSVRWHATRCPEIVCFSGGLTTAQCSNA